MTTPDLAAERAAEVALQAAGIRGARVHAHGDVARIAVPSSELERLIGAGERESALAAVRATGFRFVSIDLEAAEPVERAPSWRDVFFKYRGTLLALPAVALGVFGKPSAVSIAFGVPLALAGEAVRCWAVGYSGVTTRSDRVTAPALTTAGPYAYVRNPLYVGNFITAVGFTLAFCGRVPAGRRTVLAVASLGTMLGVYAAIVPLEEAYLRQTFGDDFDAYVARVPRLVPLRRAAEPQSGHYDASVIAKAETRTFVTFAAMLVALAVKARPA